MHGREDMCLVSSATTVVGVVDSSTSLFLKDGRKISVGDSALFKPSIDSPPFVGIIRCWTSEKENNLKLRVNWLYRPAEVKLAKGVVLEAAPNEVFYSFHSDEIPAASLLHPCKVAFLPKGVELPPGISSFVCRRVYDITNKCLWWLTDRNFIDERQEEVDQLLHKTRVEMHASAEQQQGSRSPKPVNGSAATSPLKHSPDSVQNSSSNPSSHKKGRKRERNDLSVDAVKRERSSRPDDGDSGLLRSESNLNFEIAKFAEKGGLMDSEAVARLVRLMQPEKSEKKIDLGVRSMLAGIIAATDKLDCLNQFVQLRGLLVLNEWLQEVHKGKIGDSGNLKNSDKSVDDFLLVLLRALDKLPVNLNALQMCNIGKSVNHLRSHKNSEIQKKARSLVDTWKKRVEAEMNINDSKSGSSQAVQWQGRLHQESSHGGNRHLSGSDAAVRSSVTHHSSLKTAAVKPGPAPGESNSKSASVHPSSVRSALSPMSTTESYKDSQPKIAAGGGSSEPQTITKEEKSSSSSQSHTNSQGSSDQAKNMVLSGKEDTRRSTAGSRSLNKTVGTSSKHRKIANGPSSGVLRETASNKSSSISRSSDAEKVSHITVDASVYESNNHKLIVKIPNRGRGPAQSITGGSLEDSSCRNSGASSPALSEKHDQSDASLKGNKHDSNQLHEVDGSSTSAHQKTCEPRKLPSVSKIAGSSPSRNEIKSRKTHDSSFSSMNALIESCAKFSEANVPISAGDDVGMNLLASVAAGEISKSTISSPAVSPHNTDHTRNQKQLRGDDAIQQGQCTNAADAEDHMNVAVGSKVDGENSKLCIAKVENFHQSVEGCTKNSDALDETASKTMSAACSSVRSGGDLVSVTMNGKVKSAKEESLNDLQIRTQEVGGSLEAEDKFNVASFNVEPEEKAHRDSPLCPPNCDDEKSSVHELQRNSSLDQSTLAAALKSESLNKNETPMMVSTNASLHLAAVTSNHIKTEKSDDVASGDLCSRAGNNVFDKESDPSVLVKEGESGGCYADVDQERSCKDRNNESKESPLQQSGTLATQPSCSGVALRVTEKHSTVDLTKSTAIKEEAKETGGSAAENDTLSPASGGPDVDSKLGFDLNEGFNVDEGKHGEGILSSGHCPDIVCPGSSLQMPVSFTSSGLLASVTVAAAAKGPFVPPDDLLWNKQELRWKGSAATSAFRPAEPRKAVEVSLGPNKTTVLDDSSRPTRFPLDIDLNVADESSGLEFTGGSNPVSDFMNLSSFRSSGGLDLDLNRVDESSEMVHVGRRFTGDNQRVEGLAQHVKSSTSNVFYNGEASSKRDFDLNDGPAIEEPVEQMPSSLHNRGSIPLQPPPLGPRINCSDTGNCFPWYPPGTSYSVSMTPSALSDRDAFSIVGMGGGPQRVMGGPTSALSFTSDAYRGSVLSSSPALPFQGAPFQYPVLPFGSSFPLPTSVLAGGSSGYMDPAVGGRISAISSQLVGNAGAAPFQYPHAYVVSRSIPDIGNNGVIESNHKWGKQGLDLNSGPGVLDVEGRDESLTIASRQVSTISSQSLAEDQARMYSMGGGGPLKRKESEGGWNIDKLNFKQSSWR
ncbi:flocculation protein FLO11-like [Amaranthus tricolor]|uniref:flocculation protein FLO11-like n=1 Tax=Amaranthus tricolor TaxID=29722 RepID=UPI002589497C|nr:flocculation protein FLO11-like [Amaranthus tricolor]